MDFFKVKLLFEIISSENENDSGFSSMPKTIFTNHALNIYCLLMNVLQARPLYLILKRPVEHQIVFMEQMSSKILPGRNIFHAVKSCRNLQLELPNRVS